MKVTRRELIGRCNKLQAQLAASGHESRKVRAARLAKLTADNEALHKRVEALSTENENLRSTIATMRAENAAAAAAKKEPEAA